MTTVLVMGLLVCALVSVALMRRPASGPTEHYQALLQRKSALEQQLAAMARDRQIGDVDLRFADEEQAAMQRELLEVLEALENTESEAGIDRSQPLPRLAVMLLFAVLASGAGGFYYLSQGAWWQLVEAGEIVDLATVELADAAEAGAGVAGTQQPPDIGAMVNRLATRLQQNPDDGEGWKRLGRSYWVLERYQESEQAYARAAELLPEDFTLIQGYAMSRVAAMSAAGTEIPVAAAILQMVERLRGRVEQNPEEIDGYRALASIYVMVSERRKAVAVYEQILQSQPDDIETAVMAASNQFLIDDGELTAAVTAAYERIAVLDPQNQSVTWYRGYQGYKQANWQQVVEYWQPLVEQLPTDSADSVRIRAVLEEARQQLTRPAAE